VQDCPRPAMENLSVAASQIGGGLGALAGLLATGGCPRLKVGVGAALNGFEDLAHTEVISC
jgi:hypothetical protein